MGFGGEQEASREEATGGGGKHAHGAVLTGDARHALVAAGDEGGGREHGGPLHLVPSPLASELANRIGPVIQLQGGGRGSGGELHHDGLLQGRHVENMGGRGSGSLVGRVMRGRGLRRRALLG